MTGDTGSPDRVVVNLDDLGPGCGGVTVVAGIRSRLVPQILALCACERGPGVAAVTAGRYALKDAGDMTALAVNGFVRAGQREAGRKMIEGLRGAGRVEAQE